MKGLITTIHHANQPPQLASQLLVSRSSSLLFSLHADRPRWVETCCGSLRLIALHPNSAPVEPLLAFDSRPVGPVDSYIKSPAEACVFSLILLLPPSLSLLSLFSFFCFFFFSSLSPLALRQIAISVPAFVSSRNPKQAAAYCRASFSTSFSVLNLGRRCAVRPRPFCLNRHSPSPLIASLLRPILLPSLPSHSPFCRKRCRSILTLRLQI